MPLRIELLAIHRRVWVVRQHLNRGGAYGVV